MSTYNSKKKRRSGRDLNIKYSSAFKQKVVTEVEAGVYSVIEVERIYGVTRASIYNWLRRFGKAHLINRTVRVEMRGESDRIKDLEKEKHLSQQLLQNLQD